MGDKQKRRPENGGADREVIFEMAGASAKFSGRLAVFVEAIFAKAGVGLLIVVSEIEIVLDERSAREGVIADAVSAHPGIEHGQRKKKEHKEKDVPLCADLAEAKRSNLTTPRKTTPRNEHPKKLAHWIQASRTRKMLGKNRNLLGRQRVFAPCGNSAWVGSIISF